MLTERSLTSGAVLDALALRGVMISVATRSTIAAVETGKHDVGVGTLVKLCRALECSLDRLVFGP